jgi:lipid A 3-O-deacylase
MSRLGLTAFLIALATASVAATARAQSTPDSRGTLSLMIENDLFGSGTDRHFTHGTKISYTTREHQPSEDDPIALVARLVPFWPDGARARATYALGQNIYTPDDITDPNPRPDDRPYAGWLYLSGGFIAVSPDARRSDAVVLELGVVGPASLAEETQTNWHDWFDFQDPKGWDHQLENEPGFVLMYEHTRAVWRDTLTGGLSADFVPNVGFALGNVSTYLSGGATIRLGGDLTADLGPPRIRPSLPGSSYIKGDQSFNWYTFASVGGRLVGRNIFLDGNTFTDSQSVEKKPFVADLQAGLAMMWADWRLTYTYVLRSKEFETQDRIDKFGAISLSYRF